MEVLAYVMLFVICCYACYKFGEHFGKCNVAYIFVACIMKSRDKDKFYPSAQEVYDRMKLRQRILDEFRVELLKDGIEI